MPLLQRENCATKQLLFELLTIELWHNTEGKSESWFTTSFFNCRFLNLTLWQWLFKKNGQQMLEQVDQNSDEE